MTDITERLRQYGDGLPTGLMLMRNAADEIEHLRARVAELEAADGICFTAMLVEIDGHAYGLRPGAARIVREALRDAGRYRWLRHGDNDDEVIRGDTYGLAFLPRNAELDEAIDAAMAKDGA